MIQSEVWKIAIDALRANKIKAFLTMLGVVIGSACIVLVVTISLIGRNYIIAQIEGVGSNIVYAELVRTGSQSTTLSDEITLSDLVAVRDTLPVVARVARPSGEPRGHQMDAHGRGPRRPAGVALCHLLDSRLDRASVVQPDPAEYQAISDFGFQFAGRRGPGIRNRESEIVFLRN